ncbi:hypothetical protein [Dictyobacter arantiisoli]|uniref:Uncharacterized protein n=1 Tax=Dictyobacter arantiisoli TaxID=2014874 RepID=A0A5A5TDW9_9CHLR|nr:hypothetical protein [Dictyobacter arantiisoli]GCF09084.1 hypothetical protein KDI_26480 [Dictyobacter arantiisoli]
MITEQIVFLDWHLQEDTLTQIASTAGEQIILKGTALPQFEFGATLRLIAPLSEGQSALGILAHYSNKARLLIRFIQQQERWALAVETVGVAPVVNRVIALPADFDPADWHTLRLIQQVEQTDIYLDGTAILRVLETAYIAQPGIYVNNAGAEYSHISQSSND